MPLTTTLAIIYGAVIDQNIKISAKTSVAPSGAIRGSLTAYRRKWLFMILWFYC